MAETDLWLCCALQYGHAEAHPEPKFAVSHLMIVGATLASFIGWAPKPPLEAKTGQLGDALPAQRRKKGSIINAQDLLLLGLACSGPNLCGTC